MDWAGDKPLTVKARITLLPTDEGGKQKPITKHYRPNHNFGDSSNRHFFIGQVELDENEWMHPGETRELSITFLNVKGLVEKLQPGVKWRMQEGGKLVGTAEVVELLNET